MTIYKQEPLDGSGLCTIPATMGGGNGHALTGHHEIILPLLAAALIERA